MKFSKIMLAKPSRTLLTSCLLCVSALACSASADSPVQNHRSPATLSNQGYGKIAAAITGAIDTNGESSAGDLVADAQLMATQAITLGRAQIALVNPSSLGSQGLTGSHYPHDIDYNELQALQPQRMALVTLSLTAEQIKYVLEQQFAGCGMQTRQTILQVSNGFSFAWKPSRGTCAKIREAKLTPIDMSHQPPIPTGDDDVLISGGVVLNPNKTYRVTVNEFLAKGGDNFTILKDGLNPTEGVDNLDALAAYLEKFNFPIPPYNPGDANLNLPRLIQLPLP